MRGRHVLRSPALFIGLSGGNGSANLPALVLETFMGKRNLLILGLYFLSLLV